MSNISEMLLNATQEIKKKRKNEEIEKCRNKKSF